MIKTYDGKQFKSKGIDLNCFNKQEQIDRFAKIKVTGVHILLLVYKEAVIDKTASGLYIPEKYQDSGYEYNSYSGLVLQIGELAFKAPDFYNIRPFEVGDWVLFPRSSCLQFKYEDEPLVLIEDFKIKLKIDDPSKISR